MNGVCGYWFGSDPSNIGAHIITIFFFMSSKPQKDSLHESLEEVTARRKRTLAELKQLLKCYSHNSDLLHATTFALRALRSDMRKKLRGCEEIEEVNVAGDDGDELHRDDGVFRATSDDDESHICTNVILPYASSIF